MTIATAIQGAAQSVAPDTAPFAHAVTAAALGGGFSSFAVWGLQTFAHVIPPASVEQWFTAIGIVAASWLLRKLGQ